MSTTVKRDAAALASLGLGTGGAAALAFAVQAVLARTVAVDVYGHFSAALAVVTIVAPAVGFGIPAFWLHAYGSEGWRAMRWVPASLRFVSGSAVVCAAVVALWAWLGARDRETGYLLLWLIPAIVGQGAVELCAVRYQLEGRFAHVSAWQFVQQAMRFLVVALAAWLHAGVVYVAAAFSVIAVCMSVVAWQTLLPLRDGRAVLEGHKEQPTIDGLASAGFRPGVVEVARQAWPYGIASVLYFAYTQSGLVVAANLLGPVDAGRYTVVVTMLAALYLLPSVLFQKLMMPRLHRWAASDGARLRRAFRSGNRWMALGGTVAGLVLAAAAPTIVPLAFGERYRDAVPLIQWVALCAPLRFVTTSASSVMMTRNLIAIRNRCAFAALAVSIMLGVLLMPRWGLAGAVAATIAGEAVWCVLSVLTARQCLASPIGGRASLARDISSDAGNETDAAAQDSPAPRVAADVAAQSCRQVAPVSVVVPCYRSGATLERAVESVFRQTWRPAELILVDDASPDDTLLRIEEMQRRYGSDWIRVLALPNNGGPGIARNAGWRLATQQFVAFLDADDTWHPDKIACQCGWMSADPAAAITAHPVEQLTDGEALSGTRVLAEVPDPVSRRAVLFSNRFTPSSVMVRADVTARFDERKRHAEDYFMLLQLVLVERGSAYLFRVPLSHVYKAQFGAGGLSAQLWKIQQGEQHNYRHFRRIRAIGIGEWCVYSVLSFAKYLRRCALSGRFA